VRDEELESGSYVDDLFPGVGENGVVDAVVPLFVGGL
jgi:hypothetical protein